MGDDDTQGDPELSAALHRIASLLKKPVGSFFDAKVVLSQRDEAELLRLWGLISDPAARRELLDHARVLSSSSSDKNGSSEGG